MRASCKLNHRLAKIVFRNHSLSFWFLFCGKIQKKISIVFYTYVNTYHLCVIQTCKLARGLMKTRTWKFCYFALLIIDAKMRACLAKWIMYAKLSMTTVNWREKQFHPGAKMNVPNVTLLLLLFKAHLVISVIRFSPYDIVIVTDVIVLTQPREPVLQLSTALKTDHEINTKTKSWDKH